MKKSLILVFGLGLARACFGAGLPTVEQPVLGFGTPASINVSSGAFTMVPSSSSTQTSGRFGIYINNPSTSAVVGIMGNCTSTSIATTIRPLQIAVTTVANSGPGPYYISMREDVCLWLMSLDTSKASQQIHYQEVKQ